MNIHRLFEIRESKDRGTKLLQFIGNVIVNENKCEPKPKFESLHEPKIITSHIPNVEGSRKQFERLGKKAILKK